MNENKSDEELLDYQEDEQLSDLDDKKTVLTFKMAPALHPALTTTNPRPHTKLAF